MLARLNTRLKEWGVMVGAPEPNLPHEMNEVLSLLHKALTKWFRDRKVEALISDKKTIIFLNSPDGVSLVHREGASTPDLSDPYGNVVIHTEIKRRAISTTFFPCAAGYMVRDKDGVMSCAWYGQKMLLPFSGYEHDFPQHMADILNLIAARFKISPVALVRGMQEEEGGQNYTRLLQAVESKLHAGSPIKYQPEYAVR